MPRSTCRYEVLVVGVVAEEAGRDRRLCGHAAIVQEDARELFEIHGQAHGLTKLLRALPGGLADDGVVHVEAEVVSAGEHGLVEVHPHRLHFGRELFVPHHLVEALVTHPRGVVANPAGTC